MKFERALMDMLAEWETEAIDVTTPLLQRLSGAQKFYNDNRESLLILIADTFETEDGVRIPDILKSMDQIVNLWFGIIQDFRLSEEGLEIER